MKISTLIILGALCIGLSTAANKKETKRTKIEKQQESIDLNKGKREAAIHSYPLRSSHLLQLQPAGGSLSIGAGYSFGGTKTPSFSYTPSFSSSSHFPAVSATPSIGHNFGNSYPGSFYSTPSFSHQPSFTTHSTSPKTRYTSISGFHIPKHHLNPGYNKYAASSLNLLSSTSPQSFGHAQILSKPQLSIGIPHYASLSKPEGNYGTPMTYTMALGQAGHLGQSGHTSSVPSYAAGIQGLGAFATSGHPSSGPLFTPAVQSHDHQSQMYSFPSLDSHNSAQLGHYSFGGSDNSIGYSSGSKKYSLLGGQIKGHHTHSSHYPSSEFKPSVYLGSSAVSSSNQGYSHSTPTYETTSASHSSLLANPIYVSQKLVTEPTHTPSYDNSLHEAHTGGDFHGSVSMTGSYEIPSSGHSASSLSFGGNTHGFASPSASYGVPSFGHNTENHAALSSVYGAPTESHESYQTPASHGSLSSGFGGFSSNHGFGSNAASDSYQGVYSKHKVSGLSEDNVYPEHTVSSFGSSEHASESKDMPVQSVQNFNAYLKGSYSDNSNAYSSPVESYRQAENKYDTIKYSHDFGSDQM